MKTYWDYTEKERAALSVDDVRRLLDFELMNQGVLKVEAPKLEPIAEVTLPKTRLYAIKHESGRYGGAVKLDILFPSLESAEAFLRLAPAVRCHDYESDANFAKPMLTASIEPEDAAQEQDVMNALAVLRENKAAKERNEKAGREYEENVRAMEKAGKGIWDDWHAQHAAQSRCQKVMDTLAEYLRLTEGDRTTALKFLGKAFSQAETKAASEWFGVPLEVPPGVEPAPKAAPLPVSGVVDIPF